MIMVIPICAIFVMIIKSMLNPIKGSGEFIQLARLESETNQSKKMFSTIITIIIIVIIIIIIITIWHKNYILRRNEKRRRQYFRSEYSGLCEVSSLYVFHFRFLT